MRAFQSQDGAKEPERLFSEFTPSTYVSSVVMHGPLVSASTAAQARQVVIHDFGQLSDCLLRSLRAVFFRAVWPPDPPKGTGWVGGPLWYAIHVANGSFAESSSWDA